MQQSQFEEPHTLHLAGNVQPYSKDLNQADSLLTDDNDVTYDNNFVRDYSKGRVILFNKFAVKATKARVYYAMGNYTEAAKYAREVINAHRTLS